MVRQQRQDRDQLQQLRGPVLRPGRGADRRQGARLGRRRSRAPSNHSSSTRTPLTSELPGRRRTGETRPSPRCSVSSSRVVAQARGRGGQRRAHVGAPAARQLGALRRPARISRSSAPARAPRPAPTARGRRSAGRAAAGRGRPRPGSRPGRPAAGRYAEPGGQVVQQARAPGWAPRRRAAGTAAGCGRPPAGERPSGSSAVASSGGPPPGARPCSTANTCCSSATRHSSGRAASISRWSGISHCSSKGAVQHPHRLRARARVPRPAAPCRCAGRAAGPPPCRGVRERLGPNSASRSAPSAVSSASQRAFSDAGVGRRRPGAAEPQRCDGPRHEVGEQRSVVVRHARHAYDLGPAGRTARRRGSGGLQGHGEGEPVAPVVDARHVHHPARPRRRSRPCSAGSG